MSFTTWFLPSSSGAATLEAAEQRQGGRFVSVRPAVPKRDTWWSEGVKRAIRPLASSDKFSKNKQTNDTGYKATATALAFQRHRLAKSTHVVFINYTINLLGHANVYHLPV